MFRVLLACVITPALLLAAVLALQPRSPRADLVVSSDSLRTIDPQRVTYMDDIQVASALFEGLTRLNPLTLQPEPGVAERWETEADGDAITFTLRETARWSNGARVTAADFRRSWLRVLDPRLRSQYAATLHVIRGAKAYYTARLDADAANDPPAETVGIAATDDRTLVVRLETPCPYFLDLAAFPTLMPVHESVERVWPLEADKKGLALGPATLICNGAFVLQRWDFKRRLLLSRNPHYWDADATNMQTIEVAMIGDSNAALMGYETGRIDQVSDLDTPIAIALRDEMAAGRRKDFHCGERFSTFFFRVNCRRPPLDNVDLRRALALALDRAAICERVLGLGETPAYTYVPPAAIPLMARRGPGGESVLYEPAGGLGQALDAAARERLAREHLTRSGFDRVAAERPIKLAYATDSSLQRRVCEAVQQQWETVLGIRVELQPTEVAVLSRDIRNLDYDVARSDWFGDYMDPGTFLDMYVTGSGQNRTGWSSGEYDRLIAAAAGERDDARRFALFRQAEALLCNDQLPIIPVYFKTGNYLLRPGLGGVGPNIRDILPIHRIRRLPPGDSDGAS